MANEPEIKKHAGGRPRKGEATKLVVSKTGNVSIGCVISQELSNRLEAFRKSGPFEISRAQIMSRAIEQFLDREAPQKGGKAKG